MYNADIDPQEKKTIWNFLVSIIWTELNTINSYIAEGKNLSVEKKDDILICVLH